MVLIVPRSDHQRANTSSILPSEPSLQYWLPQPSRPKTLRTLGTGPRSRHRCRLHRDQLCVTSV
ncbi:hypothetical protein CH063_15718 [Colletotrichum higginsianum]|uniref:Uncharacterized protein n=1 Tax=Colletotrichum higginsianum (strain IMI 349063) TaxID=759273 RepID=H1W446_COLHI|nr:hypothetical protein CH063_15718 [Colletotrichum higginsianum]